MKVKASNIRTHITDGGEQEIVLTIKGRREIVSLKDVVDNGKLLSVEIKQHRDRRSLDANSYCWVLVQKIADAIQQTPENIYREFIRRVGRYRFYPIKDEEVAEFIAMWGELGIGWFAEEAWPSKGLSGYTTVKAWYGSSQYNTKEMSVLIEEIIGECKEMDIETLPPDQVEALVNQWGETKKV